MEELHPVEAAPEIDSFEHFTLHPGVQEAIREMGISVPTPIQALAIQPALDGKDVIAKAETGTGKTLAFGAPMMTRVDTERSSVLGLVLCPTRELAQQVAGVLEKLGEKRGIRIALLVGGDPMHPQVDALRAGAQVVVGTPGRVLDLAGQRFLNFPWTEFVVLDEADEMLEIGFLDDVEKILNLTPPERQTMLFSATFPAALLRLARKHTQDPAEVATAKGVASVETISHQLVRIETGGEADALKRILRRSEKDDVFLVFCERRTEVDRLMRILERLPYSIKALHGGYDQASRFRVMSAFRTGEVKALVATDVASRGLDVAHVSHVLNLSPPRDITDYTHRAGRTGRAGRQGVTMTLVSSRDERRWRELQRQMTWDVEELSSDGERGDRDERPSRGRSGAPDRGGRGGRGPRSRDGSRSERGDRDRGDRREERGRRERGEDRGREARGRDEREESRGRVSREGGSRRPEERSEGRPERPRRPRREDDLERASEPARGAERSRDERPGREERARGEESGSGRGRRGGGKGREERSGRGREEPSDRGGREERPVRGGREERSDRGGREERPDRGGREERPDRGGREERSDRGGREERPDRGGREERPRHERSGRGRRDERPRREEADSGRGGRDERPRRGDSESGRGGRGEGRGRRSEPAQAGRESGTSERGSGTGRQANDDGFGAGL